ncbi:MAG: type II toxin-antitoxin system HicB family antitoxin, partial [Cyclobacteriaceae bacterium]|nr:type II toxin-antitoxin system HicB family antitoxin [Cyclobacteriaceae bacterium]
MITVEKTETGFSAYARDYPIFTTGTTVSELMTNGFEAVQLYFEDESIALSREDLRYEIDFQQFFKYYKILNARVLAEKIGMNPSLLSQYVKGHKKPSAKQVQKILDGIHQVGSELVDISLIC